MKHFNNKTNDDTNNNNTNDDKIRGQISDIRMILSRLGNTVTNNDRKKVRRKLYEIEKQGNLSIRKKKRFMMILSKQQILSKKKKNINIMTVMIQITTE